MQNSTNSLRNCPDCKVDKWVDVDEDLRRCSLCLMIVHKQWLEETKEKILTLEDIDWAA